MRFLTYKIKIKTINDNYLWLILNNRLMLKLNTLCCDLVKSITQSLYLGPVCHHSLILLNLGPVCHHSLLLLNFIFCLLSWFSGYGYTPTVPCPSCCSIEERKGDQIPITKHKKKPKRLISAGESSQDKWHFIASLQTLHNQRLGK